MILAKIRGVIMEEIKYYKPKTLEEAQHLMQMDKEAVILSGGSFVISALKRNSSSIKSLIDIKGIESLKTISFSKEGGLYIGANMTLSEIAHHKVVVEHYDVLADALESVGSGQIRNRVTLVGNNCTGLPSSDTSPILLTLEAVFEVYSDGQIILVPAKEFYKGGKRNRLAHSDIVVGIRIPYYKSLTGVFTKISRRKEFDIAIINSVVIKIGNTYRVALGGAADRPLRVYKVEEYLKDKVIDLSLCEKAAEIAMNECSPVDDIRASKVYRLNMIKIAIKRSLIELNNLEVDLNV